MTYSVKPPGTVVAIGTTITATTVPGTPVWGSSNAIFAFRFDYSLGGTAAGAVTAVGSDTGAAGSWSALPNVPAGAYSAATTEPLYFSFGALPSPHISFVITVTSGSGGKYGMTQTQRTSSN